MYGVALGLMLLAPQAPWVFDVDESGPEPLVSADRTAISAGEAIQSLGRSLGWRVEFATPQLEADLSLVSLDLSLDRQPAPTVARLIAAASGADTVFDERDDIGRRSVLHVVNSASAEIESGRQRMRRLAMGWYETFLSEDFELEAAVQENATEVRMHLGQLLLEQGELENALQVYHRIEEEDANHEYIPLALLRIAQTYHDLGKFAEAEEWARKVSRMHPSREETAAATVLLGRNLIAQQRYDECVGTMRASILPLANTPEITDILLITAEAHAHRGRPDYVLDQMRLLANSHDYRDLTESQWLDYHFLRGLGAEGNGEYAEAMEMLEIFLGTGSADPRRGQALVMLARCYLALDKLVESNAAANQAVARQSEMSAEWRKEARIVQAKSALALGQKDEAFADLEREVRRSPEDMPELLVFLIEQFIDDQRYSKAIAVSELMTDIEGAWGDKARYLAIVAMWRQNPRAEMLQGFLVRALEIAPKIQDEVLQRRAAEIIGQAYGRSGQWDRAVNAYHGVIR